MPTVIAVVQQKGGCAKTTTSANLAAGLAGRGFRVLAIDTDPQNALAYRFGASPDPYISLKEAIFEQRLRGAIAPTQVKNLVIVPADESFDAVEIVLLHSKNPMKVNPMTLLDTALRGVKDEYDFVVIDTPTGLNHVPFNAIAAADFCVVPSDAGPDSFRMLTTTLDAIEQIRAVYKPHVAPKDFFRVVMTMVTHQEKTENELFEAKLDEHFPGSKLQTKIRRRVTHKLAGEGHMTIYDFYREAPHDQGAREAVEDTENLINEVLSHAQTNTEPTNTGAAELQRQD